MKEETEDEVLERVNEDRRQIDFKLTLLGVYSLPKEWKDKSADELQPHFDYEINMLGMTLKGGKLIPRALTDEEREEAEAAKQTKGKAPPPKGKGPEKDEASPEELDKLEKLKAEKEELERKKKEEWDALDEETKFYRTYEDIYKEPAVKFQIEVQDRPNTHGAQEEHKDAAQPNEAAPADPNAPPKTHFEDMNVQQSKSSGELIELEEAIIAEKGCWIFFNKLAPKEEAVPDPKAKGAKGGKGPNTEEEKPTYGRAWVDLSLLNDSGETKVKSRVFLETAEVKKQTPETDAANPAPTEEAKSSELLKVFEEAKTYVMLELEISEPIVPTEDKFIVQAQPHDLILPKSVTLAKVKPVKDPDGDFRKQCKLAIESINKEYLGMFEEDLKREGIGGCSDETFEARKEQFLYDFNTSGKYHIMKEKLKKTIVRIVRDTFKKKQSFKGLHMDEKDHFYTIMYSHLVHQIQSCIKEMCETRKDVLHENILISDNKIAQKEVDILIDSHTKESEDDRLARLAEEYEELGELSKAHSYIKTRVSVNPNSIDLWRSYSLFMLRNESNFDKAQECLKEAITLCEDNDNELFLVYGALLVQMKEKKKALVFLTKVCEDEESQDQYIRAHMLLSILYHFAGEEDLKQKHLSYAKRMKLRQQGQIAPKRISKESKPFAEVSDNPRVTPTLSTEEIDALYYDLIESLLIPEGLTKLAIESLDLLSDADSKQIIKIKAKIMFGERKYEEVIETIEEYLDENKFDVEGIKIMADTYYILQRYEESEKSYLRAIRRGANDPVIKKRLGLIYIRNKKWKEAKTVFDDYCNNIDSRCAYAWRYLGMSAWKLRDIDGAEKSFQISNLLDTSNAETWGLLTVICLIVGTGQNRAFQCYQRALKLGLNNFEIFSELGYLFTKARNMEKHANYCYDRALQIDRSQEDVWLQYGDFSKETGNLKKSVECYENAVKCIKGEVKLREASDKLEQLRRDFDKVEASLLGRLKHYVDPTNQISIDH